MITLMADVSSDLFSAGQRDNDGVQSVATMCQQMLTDTTNIPDVHKLTLHEDSTSTPADDDGYCQFLFDSHVTTDDDGQYAQHPCCSVSVNPASELPQAVCSESSSVAELMRSHSKHVFILSDAGKPVYTRYGSEEEMASFMGVIQALVSFVGSCSKTADDDHASNDQLISMETGPYRFVFCRRPPLILCIVSRLDAVVAQLQSQLLCLYDYIVSVLTASQLKRIFDERKNFDLRRLLTGTHRTLDRLLASAESDFCLMLDAVPCLTLSASLKDAIVQAMTAQCAQVKSVIFAILLVNDQLLAATCRKGHTLSWADSHLLINLVASNPSFRDAESWSPICLPGYDENCFLSAHISYLADQCPACLLLLTDDKGAFFEMSAVRSGIIQRLAKGKSLAMLNEAVAERAAFTVSDLAVQDLIHFVYKQTARSLYTSVPMAAPYASSAFYDYLFNRYAKVLGYVRQNRAAVHNRYVYYATGALDNMLAWVTPAFELYAAFNPLITKVEAIGRVEQLMHWIKKEEPNLFPAQ